MRDAEKTKKEKRTLGFARLSPGKASTRVLECLAEPRETNVIIPLRGVAQTSVCDWR